MNTTYYIKAVFTTPLPLSQLVTAIQSTYDNGAAGRFSASRLEGERVQVIFQRDSGDDLPYISAKLALDEANTVEYHAKLQLAQEIEEGAEAADQLEPLIAALKSDASVCYDTFTGVLAEMYRFGRQQGLVDFGNQTRQLIAAKDEEELDTLLQEFAEAAGYFKTLEVPWKTWHFGKHAEQAASHGLLLLGELCSLAWSLHLLKIGTTDEAQAQVEATRFQLKAMVAAAEVFPIA